MADTEAPKKIGKFKLNWQNGFFIDLNDNKSLADIDKANFAKLSAGVNNSTPATNETAATDEYYDGEGFGTSDVTSKRLQVTIGGHRLDGDPAQDHIASKLLEIGDELKTLFKWVQPSGDTIQGVVTLTNIVTSGGAPGAKQTFSVVPIFNGKPEYVPASK